MKSTLSIPLEGGVVLPRPLKQEYQLSAVDSLDKLQMCLQALMKAQAFPSLETLLKTYLNMAEADFQQSALQLVVDFIDVIDRLPSEYSYHPYINIFIQCCRKLGFQHLGDVWEKEKQNSNADSINEWEQRILRCFSAVLKNVQAWCRTETIKSKLRTIEYEALERCNEYSEYTEALFATNDRLIVIRLDLFYLKNLSESITLHRLNDDFSRLVNNMRTNQIFDGRVGRIMKMEYGIEKGVHAHVTFFFNGSICKPSSHIYLAQQIGEYWKNKATKGDGDYWNCNSNIADFERLGRRAVGLIHASDEIGRRNVHQEIVKYACKTEQMIKVKKGDQIKTIKRGKMPKIREVSFGRPRKQEWCALSSN